MKFPWVCPKGKKCFHEVNSFMKCLCKTQPKSCRRQKQKVNDLLHLLTEGGWHHVKRPCLGSLGLSCLLKREEKGSEPR